MQTDRYGNRLTTSSAAARDCYVDGVDRFISANAGAREAMEQAIAHDGDFALGHVGIARVAQAGGDNARAHAAMAEAHRVAAAATERERQHIHAFTALIAGDSITARTRLTDHIRAHPRDAMALQPMTGVFGLIGFSGCCGREADQLALLAPLADSYGDDWWFNGQLAFAEVETGHVSAAEAHVVRSLEANPRNANAAHIKAHICYEAGEQRDGQNYLKAWLADYDRCAPLHCHMNWHSAIWALECGETDRAWRIFDDAIGPGKSSSPAINVLTDAAAFLFRAELAGGRRQSQRWAQVSDYARRVFPEPGVAFADVHAALAHAMADDPEALSRLIRDAQGPTRQMVQNFAIAFAAFARGAFADAVQALRPIMHDHACIGGSRAQRDLVEYAYVAALLKCGRAAEADRHLATRRPHRMNDLANPMVAHGMH